ncbi:helix-turn-helix domain-containing protein [Streptomyces kurssanovii]|uniref:Helix-turn-helix transcriptional regulator n=1 Tax=Streptomyces kurssanovii TaxID=67312 RepID=A0ABV3I0M2_9ACTN
MATRTRRTQRWKELPAERPPAIRFFVSALREVKDSTSLSQGDIARLAGVSESTFSGYLNGKRVPEADKLEALYKVIQDDVRLNGDSIPHELSSLVALREYARAANGPHFASLSAAAHGEAGRSLPGAEPAASSVHPFHSDGQVAGIGVPVPLRRGDRRPSPSTTRSSTGLRGPDDHWLYAADIRHHYEAGRHWDALVLISHTATRLSSSAFPEVVIAWKQSGIEQAVESLLKSAAATRDNNAVLNIAAALHDHRQYEELGVILSAARSAEA